jgi:hypothetical protein
VCTTQQRHERESLLANLEFGCFIAEIAITITTFGHRLTIHPAVMNVGIKAPKHLSTTMKSYIYGKAKL